MFVLSRLAEQTFWHRGSGRDVRRFGCYAHVSCDHAGQIPIFPRGVKFKHAWFLPNSPLDRLE